METGQDFSLLLKPASYHCNLRCSYCFYLCKSKLFGTGMHRMSDETLERTIRQYYAVDMPEYHFVWQGGEPTLMGLDFFRQAVTLQQRLLPAGGKFGNSLQTNATLLSDSWGKFLREHDFLTGVSLDGPRAIHNRRRLDPAGKGSYDHVINGLSTLRRNRARYNILTLVSSSNAAHAEEVYRHSLEHGGFYQQYIECVETDGSGAYRDISLKPGQWGEFICRIFDLWYPRDIARVSIRLFDSVLSRLLTGRATTCPMAGDCRNHLVVEHNGNLYPCDFFVQPELELGNVADTAFPDVLRDSRYVNFGRRKEPPAPECRKCRFLPLCMGDCPKHRRHLPVSALCSDWKMFYSHTIERFERIAAEIRAADVL